VKSVLVTGKDIEDRYLDELRAVGLQVTNPKDHLQEAELIEALRGKQGYLLAGLERATESVIRAASDLELIAFLGVGYQSFVAYEVATELGIAITNTPGAMVTSVAEITVGHLIGLRRRITFLSNEAKRGHGVEQKSTDLAGQTVGIIGMGAIGSRVARMLSQGLGMRVIYASRTAKPGIESELHARQVSLDELLRSADVVSLHVPVTPETTALLGKRELGLLKPSALIVNTARAELIDGHALYSALSEGQIAGAAFDGYYVEPLPQPKDDPYRLLSLGDERFLITPHIASLTEDSWNRMTEMAIGSIKSFFATGDDAHVVNPAYQTRGRRAVGRTRV